ncbi:MAG TPA: DNA gyrase subunit A [Bacteroidales bacterium]|jgi:DNA gyrase subunit A|nr:DNA gyrase subunit A [Bacteroidales bacterium]OQC57985.1 MAG: DNA gyrase subunit A [Bacteroidetes bacterium ADurb.Bin013]HNR28327.1 DNA gyrase subunit A [Bacteroidales bacterium]HNT47966.1 DNA gyrase subunit A [Bacteroidales bacterium]HNW22392.1 DNA gyrase subunit A [Bacteroidales bacterium]
MEDRIQKINIEDEMKSAYIDYSMSVIVSRALPDVRDGLKPVHRRVLFGMSELGLASNKPTKKSARIVGEVLGKYHPHGDSSVYEAMVRMAQDWSMRYMLVEGQGNFGSVDGDSAAAMRYTEARLRRVAEEVLADMDKDTVDFKNNFDDSLQEPSVLPAKVPLLLLNGASGIAVGMATNMPPHNLGEIVDAVCAYIDSDNISVDELLKYVKGPDFPTGGIIYGTSGIREAYETGRGRIVVRAKTDIEVAPSGRETIVVTEIPYMINKRELIEKIADLVEKKKLDGIAFINDESDRNGMRIVIKLKIGVVANVVLNSLFKYTALQSSFSVNNIALVDGRPRLLNLKQLIKYFVRHRHQVVVRRAHFERDQAAKRAHILEGLLKALDILDEVIALIRASQTVEEARSGLQREFGFSEEQASAIVEMKLRQLTGLERSKLQAEYSQLMELIRNLDDLLASEQLQMKLIKDEMLDIKARFNDPRRTVIECAAGDFNPEDFYPDEDVVITISHMGYIKRTNLNEYRLQGRGGIGSKGSNTREEDFIEHIYTANMHSTMLFFTQHGKCFWLKVYEIPEGNKISKGRAIQNVINIEPGDSVCAYINVDNLTDENYLNNNYIVLCTERGTVKKTRLKAYSNPRSKGVNAITISENDNLLEACLTNGSCELLLGAREGKCVRFDEKNARPIGRTAAGVRGISIEEYDKVVGMICVNTSVEACPHVLVVSENGYGKRSLIEDYRKVNRGGKGVKTLNITEKTGKLIALKAVTDDSDLMIITRSGITIRLAVADIRLAGRATQGVRLINLREGDAIAAVCCVPKSDPLPKEAVEDL